MNGSIASRLFATAGRLRVEHAPQQGRRPYCRWDGKVWASNHGDEEMLLIISAEYSVLRTEQGQTPECS